MLRYFSRDGEEGYPANLKLTIEISYTEEDELVIVYTAETDKPTPVNLTNHSYFNLSVNAATSILGYSLQINADYYTLLDAENIPTGELMNG
jgi:aldose 1-epimerase